MYFVTAKFLAQGRGWNSIEIAYANLLQENLRLGSIELCHVQFPLFFLLRDHATMLRSVWGPLVERGRFYPPGRVDAEAANWATQEIMNFIEQEETRGYAVATQMQLDDGFRVLMGSEPNLLRRVMCADPPLVD